MKFLTFHSDDNLKVGIKTEEGILDLSKAIEYIPNFNGVPQTINEILQGDIKILSLLLEKVRESEANHLFLDEDQLDIGPSVPNPGKIICVGLNYRKHAIESNMPIPESPILFNKFNNSLSGSGDEIELPSNAKHFDYEAELAIVIGKTAKNVKQEDALQYVFGYSGSNDLSARDLQFRTNQWLLGKSLDGFCPVGPYLVSSDEVGNPNELNISCSVNGETRQHSNTADMIFQCEELVSYISHYMTLEPGDIILTGTPEGVIMGYPEEERVWLKDQDEVTIEIEKLGKLTNKVKQTITAKHSIS